jgi:DNA-binding NarL/FixJ family response regulator
MVGDKDSRQAASPGMDSSRTATWAMGHPSSDKSVESKKKAFRILIADDHEAVRRGLRSALSGAGWVVCGEAYDGQDAVDKTAELKPDLVILDVSMPNLGGLDAAREILKSLNGTKVLVFTMHESRQIRDETAAIGVHGLAVKSAPLSTLLATIDSLLIGNR